MGMQGVRREFFASAGLTGYHDRRERNGCLSSDDLIHFFQAGSDTRLIPFSVEGGQQPRLLPATAFDRQNRRSLLHRSFSLVDTLMPTQPMLATTYPLSGA